MSRWKVEPRLIARKLAVQISAAIEQSGKRVILVTSPNAGEGKSVFVRLVGPELDRVAPHRFRIVAAGELDSLNPWHLPDDRIVLVDGPAMLEDEGFLQIRKGWVSAFDGALIVVMGRKTRREELEETVSWLNAAKITPIGVVWNEFVCPPLAARLQHAVSSLRQPWRLLPPGLRRILLPRSSTR